MRAVTTGQLISNGHWSLALTVVDAEYAGVFEVVPKESVKGGLGKIQSKRMIEDLGQEGNQLIVNLCMKCIVN